ncbi:porin [Shewanella sp. NKUCC05_KAH]|jgi:predicted porin|uniref:Porin n=1 Tax=Shewanella oncorhynchi TaxID=2726434 RepID=A0AA50KF61_9GAMM|nr:MULTISPECIES: porin [Shewanella]MBP7662982.1 porin [Shewanella sp.]GCF89839.1 porin [Shewanella sp. M-Br]AVI66565.1 porin [Shewanella sp. WE21]MBS0044455.1 porin [Shewanella sp. M16]MBW3516895.1 porin [Shewanella sp. NKUCC01_JLK]
MKKTFISASVASVLALASFGALAEGPSFYGRLELALTHTDTGATLQSGTNGLEANYADENNAGTYLENNFSLLGVKGSEKIADGFDVIYQMEFQVENTSGAGDVFKARNTFLGLKTNAGTVLVGRNDSVFKQAEGAVDIFGNTNADIDRLVSAQTRTADGAWYYSPKIAGLVTLNANYQFDDNDTTAKTSESLYALSATLGDSKFKEQNYYAAVAYNKGIAGVDAYRLVGQAKFGQFKVGGLFQNSEDVVNNDIEGNTYFVNVSYDLNGVNLKAEYGIDEAGLGGAYTKLGGVKGADDINFQNFNIGADYRLAKSTMIYGQYAMYRGDFTVANAKTDLQDDNVFSVGVRYDF